MTDQERVVQRLKGQYLRPEKKEKQKASGNELHKVNLVYFNTNGKCGQRSGAI